MMAGRQEGKHQDPFAAHAQHSKGRSCSPSFFAFTFSTLLAFLSSALNCGSTDGGRCVNTGSLITLSILEHYQTPLYRSC